VKSIKSYEEYLEVSRFIKKYQVSRGIKIIRMYQDLSDGIKHVHKNKTLPRIVMSYLRISEGIKRFQAISRVSKHGIKSIKDIKSIKCINSNERFF
jgi:predicted subunit of tRNA(5-methylaminomethyl-2-thiouridylate) methyltransferase